MIRLVISLLLPILATVATADQWVDEKVVPDLLPVTPKQKLSVAYENVSAELGIEVTPSQVRTAPKVSWDADKDALYTLIMTDPDSLPPVRPILHWLLVNVKGTDLTTGVELCEYHGADPPPFTGSHRYILSVWKQNQALTTDAVPGKSTVSLTGRLKFDTVDYAKKVTGEENPTPVAGNFFKSSFNDYVRDLETQVGKMIANNVN